MREHLIGLEKKIRDSAGQDFNVNSPSQLQEILFTKLKLPTQGIKKVQSGHSTDAESLQKLREAVEFMMLKGVAPQYVQVYLT
jgi:DNA polymerase-1